MEIIKVVKPFIRRGWPNTFGNIVYISLIFSGRIEKEISGGVVFSEGVGWGEGVLILHNDHKIGLIFKKVSI